MIDGEMSASPLAAACTASSNSCGPASFRMKPTARCAARSHVLVGVERRRDHDPQRVGHVGPGQQPRGGEPVEGRHADVEQAHVGSVLAGLLQAVRACSFVPVGLGDHGQAGLVVDDHPEPGATIAWSSASSTRTGAAFMRHRRAAASP